MNRVTVLAAVVGCCVVSLAGRAAHADTVTPPPCTQEVAAAPTLTDTTSSFTTGPIVPFGVVYGSRDAIYASDANGSMFGYGVSRRGLTPRAKVATPDFSPLGLAITPDGHDLVAAGGKGAAVFAVTGRGSGPEQIELLGQLHTSGEGAIEAVTSRDGRFVFVSLEYARAIAVFDLRRAVRTRFHAAAAVSRVAVSGAPVGLAVSSDGRYLYAATEVPAAPAQSGQLITIDVEKAERGRSNAIISTVAAGCDAVRVAVADGTVFVTARESNALLEFSARDLVAHPESALRATLQVGSSPVGLAATDDGRTILVADSNRFSESGAPSSIAVVDRDRTGALRLRGYLRAGGFPRDLAMAPDDSTAVVANFESGQVQLIPMEGLSQHRTTS